MSGSVVILVYFLAMLLAIFLLWRFSHVAWYWHVLAVAAAVGLGAMPPMTISGNPVYDLAIGCGFILLLIWGAGEPFYKLLHLPRHA
jgi:hypothetical protein